MNLSKQFKPKKTDLTVLEKGLSFVPTPDTNTIAKDIKVSLDELFNRISTKYHFHNLKKHTKKALYRKTNWKAPKTTSNIQKYQIY